MFTLFLSLTKSKLVQYTTSYSALRLHSFGFEINGNYSFRIESKSPYSFQLLFADKEEFNILYPILFNIDPCKKIYMFATRINYSSTINTSLIKLAGEITEKGVYTPILLMCKPLNSYYFLSYQYQNPSSLLDYRDYNVSTIYIIFSFIFTSISMLWLINLLMYPSFFIHISHLISVLPAIRGLNMCYSSLLWEDKKSSEDIPNFSSYISLILTVLDRGSTYSIICLASYGWCIFRKNLFGYEWISAILVPYLGILTFEYLGLTNEISVFFSCLMVFLVTSLHFIKTILMNFALIIKLDDETESNVLKSKISLCYRFVASFISISFTAVLLFPFSQMNGYLEEKQILYQNIYFCCEYMLLTYFFVMKNEYASVPDPDQSALFFIEEPKETSLVVITDHI